MKGIDIFCASQASTAICLSMDQPSSSSSSASSSSSSAIQLGGRAIDRHNPIISDASRSARVLSNTLPCSSPLSPIRPQPYRQLRKTKKSSFSKPNAKTKKTSSKQNVSDNSDNRRSSADDDIKKICFVPADVVTKSFAKPGDVAITPHSSSRYLLGEPQLLDGFPDPDPVLSLSKKTATLALKQDESASSIELSSSSRDQPKPPSSNQVVVLRVSLHCKGCEGKVRKHLSRMEGVTSFNIDFAAKKVTIVGDVTPLSVLASVSKVKNAQFWTSSSQQQPQPAVSVGLRSSNADINTK